MEVHFWPSQLHEFQNMKRQAIPAMPTVLLVSPFAEPLDAREFDLGGVKAGVPTYAVKNFRPELTDFSVRLSHYLAA